MGNRLTATQWSKIKRDFPEIANSATTVILDFESRLFKMHYRRYKKTKSNAKSNEKSRIVNNTLLEILEWCEEMTDGAFYATSSDIRIEDERRTAIFYFSEPSDAAMFKLAWMNSRGIVDK